VAQPERLPGEVAASLHAASYKGAVFFLTVSNTTGGKKIAQKRVAGASYQILEELGVSPRSFRVDCIVAASGTRSYRDVRDSLLAALESPGPGPLVHPFYGQIDNCTAMPGWDLGEKIAELGRSSITLTFEISRPQTGQPVPIENKVSTVFSKNASLQDSIQTRLSETYAPKLSSGGEFGDALESQQGYVDRARGALRKFALPSSQINQLNTVLTDYERAAPANLQDPLQLAVSMGKVMDALDSSFIGEAITPGSPARAISDAITGTGDAARDTQAVFASFASFKSNTSSILKTDTVSRKRRAANRNTFDTLIRSSALGYQYAQAVRVVYQTGPEINAAVAALEVEWGSLRDVVDPETRQELSGLRADALATFNSAKLTARDVRDITVEETSTRLLSFKYYGASDLGEAIMQLNERPDPFAISGRIKMLTASGNDLSEDVHVEEARADG